MICVCRNVVKKKAFTKFMSRRVLRRRIARCRSAGTRRLLGSENLARQERQTSEQVPAKFLIKFAKSQKLASYFSTCIQQMLAAAPSAKKAKKVIGIGSVCELILHVGRKLGRKPLKLWQVSGFSTNDCFSRLKNCNPKPYDLLGLYKSNLRVHGRSQLLTPRSTMSKGPGFRYGLLCILNCQTLHKRLCIA